MRILFSILFCLGLHAELPAQNIQRTVCQGNLIRLDSMLAHNSVTVKDNRGRSLLHWAVACRKKEVFDYLIEKGVPINERDNQQKTLMHVAVQYDNEKFFDNLIELQTDDDWKSSFGASLLELAVLNKNKNIVEKLVANGIEINIKNKRGSTALEISQRIGANDVSQLLIDLGADKNLVRRFHVEGKYMGQERPGTKPQMFAPNFISTEEQEFGSVFNATGTEFYFGVDVNGKSEIRYSKMDKNQWTKPETIFSHERYGYNDPFLSNDENRLYFISARALDGESEPKDIDIWYAERIDNGWSEPINAGSNINTQGDEYYISFTDKGTMYFSSDSHLRQDTTRTDHDIYFSKFVNNEFQETVLLDENVNTSNYEADVFIAPDESYIIFCSTRDEGFGRGDLYISFKNATGTWTKAVNMGKEINTSNYEYCPFVTKDGKFLFYTSNQDIYWVSTEVIDGLKEKIK